MLSPVERLEQWCDRRDERSEFLAKTGLSSQEDVDLFKLTNGFRQIIADYRTLCEEGGTEIALASHGLGDPQHLKEIETEATAICLVIMRLADATNPQETPDA